MGTEVRTYAPPGFSGATCSANNGPPFSRKARGASTLCSATVAPALSDYHTSSNGGSSLNPRATMRLRASIRVAGVPNALKSRINAFEDASQSKSLTIRPPKQRDKVESHCPTRVLEEHRNGDGGGLILRHAPPATAPITPLAPIQPPTPPVHDSPVSLKITDPFKVPYSPSTDASDDESVNSSCRSREVPVTTSSASPNSSMSDTSAELSSNACTTERQLGEELVATVTPREGDNGTDRDEDGPEHGLRVRTVQVDSPVEEDRETICSRPTHRLGDEFEGSNKDRSRSPKQMQEFGTRGASSPKDMPRGPSPMTSTAPSRVARPIPYRPRGVVDASSLEVSNAVAQPTESWRLMVREPSSSNLAPSAKLIDLVETREVRGTQRAVPTICLPVEESVRRFTDKLSSSLSSRKKVFNDDSVPPSVATRDMPPSARKQRSDGGSNVASVDAAIHASYVRKRSCFEDEGEASTSRPPRMTTHSLPKNEVRATMVHVPSLQIGQAPVEPPLPQSLEAGEADAHRSNAIARGPPPRTDSPSSSAAIPNPSSLPAPSASLGTVVYGRAVGESHDARASAASNYTNTEFGGTGGGDSLPQFSVTLYVDAIVATTPALIVWIFRKDSKVRLGNLQPQFKALRGFYGHRNTACTANVRPYYAINVIRYMSKQRVRDSSQPTVILVFNAYYDDDGLVRSRFDLSIVAYHNGNDVITSLGTMRLTTHKSSVVIGERDLSTDRPRGLPSLMFTPQIFKSIPRPDQSTLTWGSSKRLIDQVWSRLSEMNSTDWDRYTIARNRFTTEYTRYMRDAQWSNSS